MGLVLTPLARAIASLRRGVDRSRLEPDDEEVRDAVIQRFEYTYELCWRMLKRQIERESATPVEVDRLGFRDLMRVGAERGYIADPERWFRYREARNVTSHTYDEAKAKVVYRTATTFLDDAQLLYDALLRRNPSL